MSLDKDQIKASYPLPVYNYRVTVEATTLGFSEVSGLSVDYEPVTYKHGLSFAMGAKIIPGMRQPIKLTLKKGIVTGNSFLSTWFQDAYANPFKTAKKNILIDLCDETGKPVVRWKVQGALPIKLDAPTFDANSNDVAIETLELVAHDIQVDYLPK
ncbi:MAG TPA: phage tail protein [Anaerolineae bacterium]|jgi:phage tail-like protein|nr:phage tail protein [Anaerolineae bacterium]